MLGWCVDATGRCQAVQSHTQAHFLHALDLRQRDHIIYHPPTGDAPPRFAVYVSLQLPGAFLVHTGVGPTPTTAELADVYRWALQNRAVYAYPCVRLDLLQPAPNESLATPETIADWCDTQIDAFTRYHHCKLMIAAEAHHKRKQPTPEEQEDLA